MATINVTVTDNTKGPFQILALFSDSPPDGVTVVPAAPSRPPRIAAQLGIVADPNNGGTIQWGDSQLTPTSSETGKPITAGGSFAKTNVPLAGEYVNADTNNDAMAISADGGFQ